LQNQFQRPKTNISIKEGDTFAGSYRIISQIGHGGMGAVYRVHHAFLNREFALKTIPPDEVTKESWARFQMEAKSVAKLEHKNMVKIYDLGIAEGKFPYYVMDLLEGESLAELLKRQATLPLAEALEIFCQIADGLNFAHERGFVHRDIKPGNIMLTFDTGATKPTVKILDFGIAKLATPTGQDCAATTNTGAIFGSPLYMSPEQCRGAEVDPRSDIYSIGCALYETLTGAPPFMGDSALITMVKHQKEVPLKLREASLGKDFPEGIEIIVARLLAKEKADRYQSLTDLHNDLLAVKNGKPLTTPYFNKKRIQEAYDDDDDYEDEEDEDEENSQSSGMPKIVIVAIIIATVLLLAATILLIYVLTTGQGLGG
jgi:serine/threonine-protein kinase